MRTALIRLSLAKGIGPRLIQTLITFSHDAAQWQSCPALSSRQRALVKDALADDAAFEAHQRWCEKTKTTVLTVLDDAYPKLLQQITTPPAVLWQQGGPLPDGARCALVGARDITRYAERVVNMLVPFLVTAGVATISGGARGVDGAVHTRTLEAGGHTVVVMGCGLQHCYPPEHSDLFGRIVAAGGTLISPFAPCVAPSTGTFPARNRIIAGLSPVCVVVQAAQKSGALITASYATDQNRDVAVVPGPIDEPRFAGSNQLLCQGAQAICDAPSLVAVCTGASYVMPQNSEYNESLCPLERVILENLDVPALFDTLLALVPDTSPEKLQKALFDLQVAGKITQNFAGMWERI